MSGAVAVGFYGKLPARGDFVRAGLARGFVDAWDDWSRAAIAASRAELGEAWLAAWMEAPVWRFALPDGACGPDAALGVWMPSIDRAGRHFPLAIALTAAGASPASLAVNGGDWLAGAEQAGLAALERDLAPEALAALIAALAPPETAAGSDAMATWWTDGAPLVPPCRFSLPGLPEPERLARMLDARLAPADQGAEQDAPP